MRANITAGLQRTFSSLAVYNYRLYFIGQLISVSGNWMQTIAQSWLVLQLTNSPVALGVLNALRFLPVTLLSLFGGVLADRLPKRQALFALQSLAALQATLLAILVLTGRITLWELYALSLALGMVNAFENPTRQSFVMELVGRDRVQNAVALNSSLMNTARIIGPAIAGVAISVLGIGFGFLLNAVSFAALLAALLLLRTSELFRAAAPRAKEPVFRQLGAGLRYALHTPEVLLTLILVGTLGAFGYNFSTVLPLIAKYVLHSGATGFSLLLTAMGVGSLAGALGSAYARRTTLGVLLTATGAFAVLLFLIGLSPWEPLTLGLLVALGLASVMFSTNANARLQLMAPGELRGRVLSMYFLLFAGTTPLGGFLVGVLAASIGVQPMIMLMAAVCGAGVAGVAWRAHRTGQLAPRETPKPGSGPAGPPTHAVAVAAPAAGGQQLGRS